MKRAHRGQTSTAHKIVNGIPPRDFIRTPTWLAKAMVEMANVKPGEKGLDPCCGDTTPILDAMLAKTEDVFGIEEEHDIFTRARAKHGKRVTRGNFLDSLPDQIVFDGAPQWGMVDVVVMNPPFSQLGAYKFVIHAVEHWLKPGGRCVSVVPQYVLDNAEGRKKWLDEHIWCVRIIPLHTFPDMSKLHGSIVEFRKETRPADSSFSYLFKQD